jgi:hypothetical protein
MTDELAVAPSIVVERFMPHPPEPISRVFARAHRWGIGTLRIDE